MNRTILSAIMAVVVAVAIAAAISAPALAQEQPICEWSDGMGNSTGEVCQCYSPYRMYEGQFQYCQVMKPSNLPLNTWPTQVVPPPEATPTAGQPWWETTPTPQTVPAEWLPTTAATSTPTAPAVDNNRTWQPPATQAAETYNPSAPWEGLEIYKTISNIPMIAWAIIGGIIAFLVMMVLVANKASGTVDIPGIPWGALFKAVVTLVIMVVLGLTGILQVIAGALPARWGIGGLALIAAAIFLLQELLGQGLISTSFYKGSGSVKVPDVKVMGIWGGIVVLLGLLAIGAVVIFGLLF